MRIRTQFAVQLIGGLANTLLLIALTPVLIRVIGMERYGVVLLVLGFVVYVGLADLGVGIATSQKVAMSNERDRSRIFGTALALSIFLSGFAGLIFALLSSSVVSTTIGLSASVTRELSSSWAALFLLGVATVLVGTPQGALLGLRRFITLNSVSFVATAVTILAPALWALYIGRDLSGLILSVAIGRMAVAVLAAVACVKAGLKPCFELSSKQMALDLLRYGGWQTIVGLLQRAITSIDRPFIGIFSGAASVPYLAVPQSLLTRLNVFAPALMTAVFPQLACAQSSESRHETIASCYKAIALLTPAYVAGILAIPWLLKLWMGEEFSRAASGTAVLLSIAMWLECTAYVPYVLLQATAHLRREAAIESVIVLPNLVVLGTAVHLFGVFGAAAVAVLRSLTLLIARVQATVKSAFPFVDFGLNVVALGLASLLSLTRHGQDWLWIVFACATILISATICAMRRPQFVDELALSVLRKVTVKGVKIQAD